MKCVCFNNQKLEQVGPYTRSDLARCGPLRLVVLCPAMSSHGVTSASQPEGVASGDLTSNGDSGAVYRRALIFGIVAALLGLVLYSTVAIVIGLVSGFASLAVGYNSATFAHSESIW
jgi:hypothetical protein